LTTEDVYFAHLRKFSQGGDFAMENSAAKLEETKKAWATPELKKIDIEVLTANESGLGSDGGQSS
jgi:3-dehydroquinate dehydratase